MKIDDKIRDEKLHYDINREKSKISALGYKKMIFCLSNIRSNHHHDALDLP